MSWWSSSWVPFVWTLIATLAGGYVGAYVQRRNTAEQRRADLEITERWKAVAETLFETLTVAKETCATWKTLALEAKRHGKPKSNEAN